MPIACLLLAIAVAGGTMLTFLFDRQAPRAARLCMGACLGMALLAGVGFLLALWIGLTATSLALDAGILLLPLLLLIPRDYRAQALGQFRRPPPAAKKAASTKAASTKPASTKIASTKPGSTAGYWIFYVAIAVLLGMVFSRAVYEQPDGIYTGFTNNLGDLPLHLQVINSLVHGQNIPPEDPTFAGVRFAYPFMVDFLAAMLVRSGAGVIGAMWLENMLLALALVGLPHYWTLLLTRNRAAGLIAPLLVLFSGGLGWWLLFSDVHSGAGSSSLLAGLSHDYTILPGADSLLRWGNSLTTLFVPQRSILFGIPLGILIFIQWWRSVSSSSDAPAPPTASAEASKPERNRPAVWSAATKSDARRMLAAGICAGLLPLIHAHTFLVVMAVAACLAVIFRSLWRGWLLFFAPAIALSLPELLWLRGGVNAHSFLGWQPGWDHGSHNVLWFWFVNAGPFLLALIAALLWPRGELALPRSLVKFYLPFLFCFIVPNLVRLAPWVWDNIKVLFLWYIASAPLVALLLARWWAQRSRWRWLAPLALASMVLAGALDVWRVISGTTELREFDRPGMAIAQVISAQAGPQAVVLHAPTYNTPVFLTGRRSLLGYPGWIWSRGLDYSQREADIRRIYSGDPDAPALLRQYGVDYLLVGPQELADLPLNQGFLSQYRKLAQAGPYRLYAVRGGR
jgi:hypothetical protein